MHSDEFLANSYFDIHAHRTGGFIRRLSDVITITNLAQPDFHTEPDALPDHFSAGLHPWYLTTANLENDLETLRALSKHPNLIAIGECGLDRLKGAPLDIQMQAFEKQIHLAEETRKPVVIHCVKAFPELLSLQKRLNPAIPLVIHGFNNNLHILTSLLSAGFHISLGAALMIEGSNAAKALRLIPLDRLFLETDDKDIPIQTIYTKAARLLDMKIDDLIPIIRSNFARVFEP